MERIGKGIGVWFTNLELWALWRLAQARQNAHKYEVRIRADSSKFNPEDEYLGLKAEYAFQKTYFRNAFLEERIDTKLSNPQGSGQGTILYTLGNDAGHDFTLNGLTIDVKFAYPRLIFNSMSRFKSDIAVAVHPYTNGTSWRPYAVDPFVTDARRNSHDVVIAGWITKEGFLEAHYRKDFGYGEHLCIDAHELMDAYELFKVGSLLD